MNEKQQIAKYYIVTSTMGKRKRWFRIVVNGEKTIYKINMHGDVKDTIKKRLLPVSMSNGYHVYNIALNDKRIYLSKHRLMATIFIPIPKDLRDQGYDQMSLVPNHKDGNRIHNELSNLEWTTVSGNMQHALENGLCNTYIGEKSHLAKITENDAIKICELLSTGIKPREISDVYGYPLTTVRHIYAGTCWKHIAKNYEFKKDSKCIPYKISDETIHEMCKVLEEKKYLDREIGAMFNVTNRYVNDIRNRKRRKDISQYYNF